MELVILVGLQGSGKSSFFHSRLAATHVHVSKDSIRARHKGLRQRELIEAALRAGRSVVADNTHPRVEDRLALVEIGRALGARIVGYYFDSPLAECLARNRSREGRGRVPDVALYVTSRKLQEPTWEEGYDKLHVVHPTPDGSFEVVDRAGA